MALIGTLRNKMGKIVVGAIMVTMLSFILTDLIGNSQLLGGNDNPDIAELAGKEITNAAFQAKVNELSYYFSLNTGRNPTGDDEQVVRDQAWNALIMENIYKQQFDELGLAFLQAELDDMLTGQNISPEVQQFFRDPATGTFSQETLNQFLSTISQAPAQQQDAWAAFIRSMEPGRLVNKYQNLMVKSNYVNKYEAKEEFVNRGANATIEYAYVPFLSLNDSIVSATDEELQAYLDDNEEEFDREESRSIEYVVFEMNPSQEDTAIVEREVADLREGLVNATNDSSYVVINSDDAYSFLTYQEDNLPSELKEGDDVVTVGFVSEPKIVNGNYEFYKLSRADEITRDSVLYRVAKIRKDFFVSDETINAIYRQADLFAANSGNTEEFRRNAEEQGLTVLKASNIGRNASRVGVITEGRSIALWLYNDAKKGAVSDVREIGDQYVVATMTDIQEDGLANLESVRNQVTVLVKNEKKAEKLTEELNAAGDEVNAVAEAYGDDAKSGTADIQLSSSNISGVGYAPEAIGLSFALNEEETTRAFKVKDGVLMVKLVSKDVPSDEGADLSSYSQQLAQRRLGYTNLVADFPYTYFRVFMSRNIDSAIKDFAEIEDMRYKFF